jgi:hypothetical protein
MIKNILSGLAILGTLIGVVTGGQQIYETYFVKPNIPIYDNGILVTSPVTGTKFNKKFIKFLSQNDKRTVFLSVSMNFTLMPFELEHKNFVEEYPHIMNEINTAEIPISVNNMPASNFIKLYLKNNRKLHFTHGGPGVSSTYLKGAFDITQEYIGSMYSIYHLREREIPYDEEVKIMNIIKQKEQEDKEQWNKEVKIMNIEN